MKQLFCLHCSRQFLNAQSLIIYTTKNVNGDIIDRQEYRERDYGAIEGLAKLKDSAEALGQTFLIEINQQVSTGMLYATMLIQGTSVCLAHVFDSDPMNRATTPQGYPYSRRPF